MRREFVPMTAHVVRRKPWKKKRGALSSPRGEFWSNSSGPAVPNGAPPPHAPCVGGTVPREQLQNHSTDFVGRAAAMPLKRIEKKGRIEYER